MKTLEEEDEKTKFFSRASLKISCQIPLIFDTYQTLDLSFQVVKLSQRSDMLKTLLRRFDSSQRFFRQNVASHEGPRAICCCCFF